MVLVVKNLPANAGDVRDVSSIPVVGRCPGRGHGTHSSILAWEIPWTEKSDGLQSMGWQRVRHNWVANVYTHKENSSFLSSRCLLPTQINLLVTWVFSVYSSNTFFRSCRIIFNSFILMANVQSCARRIYFWNISQIFPLSFPFQ